MKKTQLVVWFIVLLTVAAAKFAAAATSADEVAIQKIIEEEVTAWNSGDATSYSRHFARDATFTNIYGMVFNGHDAFEKRHWDTFATFFKGTTRVEIGGEPPWLSLNQRGR